MESLQHAVCSFHGFLTWKASQVEVFIVFSSTNIMPKGRLSAHQDPLGVSLDVVISIKWLASAHKKLDWK